MSAPLLLPAAERGILRVTGADRARFIHGLTTQDVKGLKPGQAARALWLTPKGKVLALLYLLVEADAIWIETDPDRSKPLLEAWSRMIITEDVILEDRSGGIAVTAVSGKIPAGSARSLPFCRAGGPGHEFWTPPEEAPGLRAALGLHSVPPRREEALRIANAMPLYGRDVTEESLPQEAGLDEDTGWISYSKGCYVGQETIARLHNLGQARQKLARLRIASETVPGNGSPVLRAGERVGKVTSAVCPDTPGEVLALALLGREAAVPGTALEVSSMQGRSPAVVL